MTVPKAVRNSLRIKPLRQTALELGAKYINNLTPECKLALRREGAVTAAVAHYVHACLLGNFENVTRKILAEVDRPAQSLLNVIATGATYRYNYEGPAEVGPLLAFLRRTNRFTKRYEAYLLDVFADEIARIETKRGRE